MTNVTRLSPAVYEQFAKRFTPVRPTENTTAVQVAYSLGVQAVLAALRESLVIDQ